MYQRFLRGLAALGFAAAFLGACSSSDDTGPGTGTLAVLLTDAPFPYDSVARADLWVVRIDAKLAEPSEADADDDADGSENGDDPSREWVTIATPNRAINLLELQPGTVTNLGATTLPSGRYRGFRLILDTEKSSVTLKNGLVLTGTSDPGIKFPSAAQTGIKVKLAEPIQLRRDTTYMVIDFDLGNSFVQRGNTISQNGLLFKPVVRAVARDITGAISGTVRAGSPTGALVPGASVEVLKAGTPITDTVRANVIATTSTDANGAFTAAWLFPTTYALRVTPPATLTTYGPALVPTVTVADGQTTSGVAVILPAK